MAARGRGLFSLYIYIENFKNILVRNHWTDFNIILQKYFLWWPSTKTDFNIVQAIWIRQKNLAARGRGLFSLFKNMKSLKIFLSKTTGQKLFPLYSLWWPSTKIVQAIWIRQKKMAARGRGLFSLYIYIEKLKNLLVRNHWTDFNIILQKCSFGDPLGRLFKLFGFVKKTWPPGGGAYFPYISI